MQERGIQSIPVRNCDAIVSDDTEKAAKITTQHARKAEVTFRPQPWALGTG